MRRARQNDKQQPMGNRKFLPPSRRGLVFDLATLVANIVLIRLFSRQMGTLIVLAMNDDIVAGRQLGLILLFAFLAQMAGAYFKRRPLQTRLAMQGRGSSDNPFGCFLILNFALSLIIFATIVALSPFGPTPAVIVPGFFLCLIPTILVWRALTPLKQRPQQAWLLAPGLETMADFALFAYVLVNLSFLNFITPAFHSAPLHSVEEFFTRVVSGLILSPLLLMYYICPRILFLVEDYRYPVTWVSMTIAILPIVFRFVFG